MQRSFLNHESGSTATLFALALVPGLVFVGGAVDYASSGRMQTALRDTLDAAAIAAAVAHARPDREDQARAFVRSNAQSRLKGATIGAVRVTFDDAAARVTISADATVPTNFLSLAGINRVNVATTSTAVWSQVPQRISLVLDTTGSLRDGGADADLRAAATNFVDIVSGGRATTNGLSMSVVPFASMVNVGSDKTSWLSPTYNSADYLPGRWDGCVYERDMPRDIAIAPPVAGEFRPHLWPKDYTAALGFNDWSRASATDFRNGNRGATVAHGGEYPIGPNVGCMAPVLPLTTDMIAVKARIADLDMLSASGGTLLTAGLAWGWRALSPDWVSFWRNNGTVQPQDKGIGGTIVFLSDGANDYYYSDNGPKYGLGITGFGRPEERRTGIGPTRSSVETAAATLGTTKNDPNLAALIAADRADRTRRRVDPAIEAEQRGAERDIEALWDRRFAQLCDSVKAAGITLYTISFGPSSANDSMMRRCATSENHYFRSPTRSDLDRAFTTISSGFTSQTTVRLIR